MKYRENLAKIINKYTISHKYGFGKSSVLLSKYLNGIQQGDYTVVSGLPSSGKRSFTDFFYVVLVLKQWFALEDDERAERPLKILYFSSRESAELKLLKWTTSIYSSMFKELLDLPTMLQGPGKLCPMSSELYSNIEMASTILDEAIKENVLQIIDGKLNIFNMENSVEEVLNSYGTLTHDITGGKFTPSEGHEKTLFITVVDDINHINTLKEVNEGNTGGAIDKFFKDYSKLGVTMVGIKSFIPFSYFLYDPTLKDIGDLTPNKAVVLHNPTVTKKKRFAGFESDFFISERDLIPRLRFATIVKNNTGVSNISIPFVIIPECGNFLELKFPTRNNHGESEEDFMNSVDPTDEFNIKKFRIVQYMRNKTLKRNK